MVLRIRKICFRILLLCFCLLMPMTSFAQKKAQKKAIDTARDNIKEGKSLDKAEAAMRTLLNDSANRHNMRIWLTLTSALSAQYEQGNEKLYLKQKQDTADLFNITRRLFTAMEELDSVDAMPDAKGRVEPKYRQKHAAYLNTIRPNLFNGGAFLVRKQNYKEALSFFEQYVDCARQPLFAAYDYQTTDPYLPQAAYWAMYCGNKLSLADDVLAYRELAERDSAHLAYAIQYEAEAYLQKHDTLQYVDALRRGFEVNPKYPYFFPRLIEHYERQDEHETAMQLAETALQTDSASLLFRYAKSTILLNTGRYDECIALCQELVADNDSLADAYYNLGLSYFNKAILLEKLQMMPGKSKAQRQKLKTEIAGLYEQSRPCLERFRALAPDQQEKWVSPLYTIYLNLNMGKEFDEIDKVRNEYRKRLK